jgi:hypothetical protein
MAKAIQLTLAPSIPRPSVIEMTDRQRTYLQYLMALAALDAEGWLTPHEMKRAAPCEARGDDHG